VARQYDLGFIPVQEERYDFVVPKARLERPPCGPFARCWTIPRCATS
jgi:putative molybdopterin biosynthesis protein